MFESSRTSAMRRLLGGAGDGARLAHRRALRRQTGGEDRLGGRCADACDAQRDAGAIGLGPAREEPAFVEGRLERGEHLVAAGGERQEQGMTLLVRAPVERIVLEELDQVLGDRGMWIERELVEDRPEEL